MPSRGGSVVRRVIRAARKLGVKHRIVPSIPALISGDVSIEHVRAVNVEDLLRRETVQMDVAGVRRYIENRTVLITGAGGSIGSEIVRQVARYNPENVVLLGRGEGSIFKIDQACRQEWKGINWWPVVADVRDKGKMEYVFQRFRPEVVFHAAANKHVPLMEANPDEAILNNVLGTRNMVELTLAWGAERFVNISTDKAVRPASVMGASKRVAEYIVEWGGRQAGEGQSFASVRFGNVLGSSGSVIPVFKRQIEQGGPVTVTHPDVSRYFMTIPEAVQLVLQAGALGGNGTIYVLDMGSPVKIVDLARDLIHLYGLEPDVDVGITFTGLRPGEKLSEELLTDEEGTSVTRYDKIFVAPARGLDDERLESMLAELFIAAYSRDAADMIDVLRVLIPTHMLAAREQVRDEAPPLVNPRRGEKISGA
jgi:FlaA1/EpsC-like NDP-sugar epimerase